MSAEDITLLGRPVVFIHGVKRPPAEEGAPPFMAFGDLNALRRTLILLTDWNVGMHGLGRPDTLVARVDLDTTEPELTIEVW